MARTHPTPGLAACWCEEPEPPRRVRRVSAGMVRGAVGRCVRRRLWPGGWVGALP